MAFSTSARPAAERSLQASFAAWAASRASSMSAGVDSATSVIGAAVAGLRSVRYFPSVGSIHLPPMKFSYRGCTLTMLPVFPGATYTITVIPFLDTAAGGRGLLPATSSHPCRTRVRGRNGEPKRSVGRCRSRTTPHVLNVPLAAFRSPVPNVPPRRMTLGPVGVSGAFRTSEARRPPAPDVEARNCRVTGRENGRWKSMRRAMR